MNFDLEKLMAKVYGENTEDFFKRAVSDSDKRQINFAFEQMFVGLSLLEWMKHVTLETAWRTSLDIMRDYIFDLSGQGYILDYLHVAVFEHRKQVMKKLSDSVHTREYIQYPNDQFPELEKSANEKIKNAIDIIQNILSNPHTENAGNQKINTDAQTLQQLYSNEHEREPERERVRK